MRKILACILAALLLTSAAACQSSETESSGSSEVSSASSAASSSASSAASESSSEVSSSSSPLSEDGKTYTGEHFTISVPEGWSCEDQSGTAVLTSAQYPDDVSAITVLEYEKEEEFDIYTQEDFEKEYASRFDDVEFLSFEKTTFHERPAYTMEYKITQAEIVSAVKQYLIDTENGTVLITLLSSGEEGNALSQAEDAFLEAMKLH